MNRIRTRRRAFTLVEVVAASAIATTVLVTALLARAHAVRRTARADRVARSVVLAERLTTDLLLSAAGGRPRPEPTRGRDAEIEWNWESESREFPPRSNGASGRLVALWTLRLAAVADGAVEPLGEYCLILPPEPPAGL